MIKITNNNLNILPESEREIVKSLLLDIDEINQHQQHIELYWIDEHTEYSPERTDPCPDYYGMYRIWNGKDYLGVDMTLEQLDISLCLLCNYLTYDNS